MEAIDLNEISGPQAEVVDLNEMPLIDLTAVPARAGNVVEQDGEVVVMAQSPAEMRACQEALVKWVAQKIAALRADDDDLTENIEIAKKNGWGCSALFRQLSKCKSRIMYYQKMQAAVEAGYCIVPNFPATTFVVRVSRAVPKKKFGRLGAASTIQPELLPAGDGRYVGADGHLLTSKIVSEPTYDGKSRDVKYFAPTTFNEHPVFPFVTAKPEIMNATAIAMAQKIFDEIAVLPGKRRDADPIVVGKIIDRTHGSYSDKVVSFLIAWYVDSRDL